MTRWFTVITIITPDRRILTVSRYVEERVGTGADEVYRLVLENACREAGIPVQQAGVLLYVKEKE